MSHPKRHSLRPRGRQDSSFRANHPMSHPREGVGEAGRRSPTAFGGMSVAEWLTLGTVWCLARETGRIAPKNPSPPVCLRVSVARLGILIPGKPCHCKPCRNGGRHPTTEVAGWRREVCKIRGLVTPFITGFATDQC